MDVVPLEVLWPLREAALPALLLRSSIEYCSAEYHAMLNLGQEEQLESIQRHAMQICFGDTRPVEELMAENGVNTLKARRMHSPGRLGPTPDLASSVSPRGSQWLGPSDEGEKSRNHWLPPSEDLTLHPQRRFNSTPVYMKRRANEMRLPSASGAGERP